MLRNERRLGGYIVMPIPTFTALNKQGCRSSEGFVVQFTGRLSAEYREGSKVVTIYVEPTRSEEGVYQSAVGSDAFDRWDGDPPEALIVEEERKRLFRNLSAGFEFLGVPLVVHQILTAQQARANRRAQALQLPIRRPTS